MANTSPNKQPQQDDLILNSNDAAKYIPALESYGERSRQRLLAAIRKQLDRGRLGAVTVGEVLNYLKNRGK